MIIWEIAICDDDVAYAKKAKKIIEKFGAANDWRLHIHIYTEPELLLSDVREGRLCPTIVFIDVEIGGTSGIDAVEELNQTIDGCKVIYLTNYLKYATDIYRTDHFYFIKKGELERRLPEVADKCYRYNADRSKQLRVALKNNIYMAIKLIDIIYLERRARYTHIHTRTGTYQTRVTIDKLEELLDADIFVRCHNSYIVSMLHVSRYKRDNIELGESSIPVSRYYQPLVRQRFVKWTEAEIF